MQVSFNYSCRAGFVLLCVIMYTPLSQEITFAAIKGSEGYDLLRAGFGEVLEEVNAFVRVPEVVVRGKALQLDVVLGSDYKVRRIPGSAIMLIL